MFIVDNLTNLGILV